MAVGDHRWGVTQEEADTSHQKTRGGSLESDGPIDAPFHTTDNSQRWLEQTLVFLPRPRRLGPVTGQRLLN